MVTGEGVGGEGCPWLRAVLGHGEGGGFLVPVPRTARSSGSANRKAPLYRAVIRTRRECHTFEGPP